MKIRTRNLLEQHSELLFEALDCLRRETEDSRKKMTEGAAECQASYDKIKDDPEACAALNASNSLFTTSGLHHMALMFAESAGKYDEKLAALEEISEALERE